MVCFSQAAAVAGKLTHDPVVMPATQAMRRENLTYTCQDLTILLCLRPSMAAPECGLLICLQIQPQVQPLFSQTDTNSQASSCQKSLG